MSRSVLDAPRAQHHPTIHTFSVPALGPPSQSRRLSSSSTSHSGAITSSTQQQSNDLKISRPPPQSVINQSPTRSDSPLHARRPSPGGSPQLTVKRVIGTTVSTSAGFASSTNSIAYTAGAGVVFLQLSETTPVQIVNERFFCAPPKPFASPSSSSSTSSLSSSSSLIPTSSPFTYSSSQDLSFKDCRRDAFSFPISNTPVVVKSGAHGIGLQVSDDPSSSSTSSGVTRSTSASASLASMASNSSISSQYLSSKDKIKSTTCVAISPDAKLLAVGETGYNPHVLVYSLAPDSLRIPLLMLGEHRFGIKRLSFSPCGRYLASLGVINDGFLHIWRLLPRDQNAFLHSSNKCLSTVNDMAWMTGSNSVLITAGIRHLRVWHRLSTDDSLISASKPSVLQCRNVVLGTFSNVTFVSIAPISSKLALVATDRGEIGLVTLNSPNESDDSTVGSFSLQYTVDFAISSIYFDFNDQVLWITGPEDELRAVPLKTILDTSNNLEQSSSSIKELTSTPSYILAMSIVAANSSVIRLTSHNDLKITDFNKTLLSGTEGITFVEQTLRLSNSGGIRGLKSTVDSRFITWSDSGLVRIWNKNAECVGQVKINVHDDIDQMASTYELREEFPNFLSKAVATKSQMVVSGDRHGVLRISDKKSGEVAQYFHAHGSEIVGIAYGHRSVNKDEYLEIVTTSGRDRTVQVFSKEYNSPVSNWTLLQTLVGHKSSVNKVLVVNNCEYILSCSNDRTVSVHKAVFSDNDAGRIVAYMPERIITLKSTPCDLHVSTVGELIVSCNDKNIYVYKFPGSELTRTYKTLDEKGDAVALKDMAIAPVRIEASENKYMIHTCLVGMGADKSIRVYDHKTGQHICSDWGHSEGVSGLEMVGREVVDDEEYWTLASSGNDGCVFVWELTGLTQYYKRTYHSRRGPGGNTFSRLNTASSPALHAPVPSASSGSASGSAPSSAGSASNDLPTQISHTSVNTGMPVRKVISKAEINRFLNKNSDITAGSSTSSSSVGRRKTLPPLTSSRSTSSLSSSLAHEAPATLSRSSSLQKINETPSVRAISKTFERKPESPSKPSSHVVRVGPSGSQIRRTNTATGLTRSPATKSISHESGRTDGSKARIPVRATRSTTVAIGESTEAGGHNNGSGVGSSSQGSHGSGAAVAAATTAAASTLSIKPMRMRSSVSSSSISSLKSPTTPTSNSSGNSSGNSSKTVSRSSSPSVNHVSPSVTLRKAGLVRRSVTDSSLSSKVTGPDESRSKMVHGGSPGESGSRRTSLSRTSLGELEGTPSRRSPSASSVASRRSSGGSLSSLSHKEGRETSAASTPELKPVRSATEEEIEVGPEPVAVPRTPTISRESPTTSSMTTTIESTNGSGNVLAGLCTGLAEFREAYGAHQQHYTSDEVSAFAREMRLTLAILKKEDKEEDKGEGNEEAFGGKSMEEVIARVGDLLGERVCQMISSRLEK